MERINGSGGWGWGAGEEKRVAGGKTGGVRVPLKGRGDVVIGRPLGRG